MNYKGTYVEQEENYVLEIHYDYYWDNGDYYQPPESTLEIEKVELNGNDITEFYFDSDDETLHHKVMEYASDRIEDI